LQQLIRFFSAVDKAFTWIIECSLIAMLLIMVIFVILQVILRNFFNSGIPWADVATRHIVLWISFLGAMLATRIRHHISIDALMRIIPKHARNGVRIALDALACTVSCMLALAAYDFVISEMDMGGELFIGIPTWSTLVIIPFGFAMIAIEYGIGIGLDIWRITQHGHNHIAGRGR